MIDATRCGVPTVRAAACLRTLPVEPARSECRACVDLCPADAVSLDPVTVDAERCDGCRLCVPACPSRALGDGPAARALLEEGLLATTPAQPFTIACREAGRGSGPAVRVRCLASLEWEAVVLPPLRDASPVHLETGDCASCALHEFAPRAAPRIALARAVAGAANAGTIAAPAPARPAADERAMSRRGMFRALLRDGRGAARVTGAALVEAMSEASGVPVDHGGHDWARRR